MIFLFAPIPGHPGGLGQLRPADQLGAKDVAFPRLNLAIYYIYCLRHVVALVSLFRGGVDTGWTFYTPYSMRTNTAVILLVPGPSCGLQLDSHGVELHRDDPQAARRRA